MKNKKPLAKASKRALGRAKRPSPTRPPHLDDRVRAILEVIYLVLWMIDSFR